MALFCLCLAAVALAAKLNDVWTLLNIDLPNGSRPQDIHSASLGWKIPTSSTSAGDTFDLEMPGVFRTKFGTTQFELVADDTVYAKCYAQDGSYLTAYTTLLCVVTSAVDNGRDITARGVAEFDFVFGAGSSSGATDVAEANMFHAGENNIEWSGLSASVDFNEGPFFNENKNEGLIYYARSTPQKKEQLYLLSGSCPDGIDNGFILITFENDFDCSAFSVKKSKDLNDFYLPKDFEDADGLELICQDRRVIARFSNVAGNYRVFLQGFYNYPKDAQEVFHNFGGKVQCMSGETITDNYGREIVVVDGDSESTGDVVETILTTTTWTESYTSTTTLSHQSTDGTVTIVVEVPDTARSMTTTTTTKAWDGSFTTTKTIPYKSDRNTVTVTVEVDTPTSMSSDGTSITSSSERIPESGTPASSQPMTQSSLVSSKGPCRDCDNETKTTTTTTTWLNPGTSKTTLSINSKATEVTVVIEVPKFYSNSSVSSLTVTPSKLIGGIPTSFCEPTSDILDTVTSATVMLMITMAETQVEPCRTCKPGNSKITEQPKNPDESNLPEETIQPSTTESPQDPNWHTDEFEFVATTGSPNNLAEVPPTTNCGEECIASGNGENHLDNGTQDNGTGNGDITPPQTIEPTPTESDFQPTEVAATPQLEPITTQISPVQETDSVSVINETTYTGAASKIAPSLIFVLLGMVIC